MITTRIAINGLGRIGRAFLKIALELPELEIVAVNEISEAENLAYPAREGKSRTIVYRLRCKPNTKACRAGTENTPEGDRPKAFRRCALRPNPPSQPDTSVTDESRYE